MSAEQYAAVLSSVQGNGYAGNNGSAARNHGANSSGVPQAQANLTAASTLYGTVSAYAHGTLTLVTADEQTVGVQLGIQRYVSSLGFAPQIGKQVTVYGFPSDQGLFSNITVTLQNGQVFTFRESTERAASAGSNSKGGH